MHGVSRKSFTERKHLRNGIRNVAVLLQAEQKARRYDTVADGVEIQGDFRADYERQRQQLTDAKNEKQYQREIQEGILKDVRRHSLKRCPNSRNWSQNGMRQSKNPEYPWHRQESQPFRSTER